MKRAPSEASQTISFTRRALVLGGAQAAVGGLLATRMGWLSIFDQKKYSLLAESNRVSLSLVPPRRGWIVDRAGKPLAMNRPELQVQLIPDQAGNLDQLLPRLADLLSLSPEDVARIRDEALAKDGPRSVRVASGIDWEHYAALSIRLPELPGVQPMRGFARVYPDGPAVAHLLGYVGTASAQQYQESRNPLLLFPGFRIGKDGLEKTQDASLIGKAGAQRSEVNARGRVIRELDTVPATPGDTLRLTIDGGLQAYAARRIGTHSGSVVVIDCANGDILCMASMPAYDPNSFSDGIGRSEWAMLRADDHLPLLNKTLQGLYPPGSTFKPASALAFLESGLSPDAAVVCTGRYRLGNSYFHCHKRGGHGVVSLHRALEQSCDIYFYHFSRQIGIDRIAEMARRLGVGQEFDLPVASQRYGTMPDRAWKQKKYGKPWNEGETLSASIGQGYVLANPLQLAILTARLAAGRALLPSLILGAQRPREMPLGIDPQHLAQVRAGMDAVVNGAGTAGRSRLQVPGIRMAGKSGTAQVRRITMAERRRGVIRNEALPWRLRDHALFTAFAPVEQPRYAVAVVLEHGIGGSAAAAPIARDVLTYLYEPDRAMATLEQLEKGWGGDVQTRMAEKARQWRAGETPGESAPPEAEVGNEDGQTE